MGKSGKLGEHSPTGHDSASGPALNSPAQTPSPGSADLKAKVMEAREAYRATLDATGHGSQDLYRVMEAAEAEWDAERTIRDLEADIAYWRAENERLRAALEQIASSKESPVAITPQQNYWRCKDIARAALEPKP